MKNENGFVAKTGYSWVTAGVLLAFVVVTVATFLYRSRIDKGALMVDEIAVLAEIFERIDKTCDIIDFDSQQNPINFLTIKKNGFVGSEVGSMNLAYPDRWDGPYLNDNPTMQEVEYMVVRTHSGYFITPGAGVVLPNGKTIGKDIILDENADIFAMMEDEKMLMFKGKALAAHLIISISPLKGIWPDQMMEAQQGWIQQQNKGAGVHTAKR